MSYCQRDEHEHIMEAVQGATRKRCLDIGAHLLFSNTRALLEAGWGGVLIEPSPKPLRDLIVQYGNRFDVIVVGGAVTVQGGPIAMRVTDDAVSGNEDEAWNDAGGFYGVLQTVSFTLQNVFDWWGGDGFDMVSIDTEGSSVDLLLEILKTEMMPRCIVVEHDGRIIEANRAARKRGYQPVHETEENLIYAL